MELVLIGTGTAAILILAITLVVFLAKVIFTGLLKFLEWIAPLAILLAIFYGWPFLGLILLWIFL